MWAHHCTKLGRDCMKMIMSIQSTLSFQMMMSDSFEALWLFLPILGVLMIRSLLFWALDWAP